MINIEDLSVRDIDKLRQLLTPKLTKYIPYEPTAKQSAFLLMNDTKEVLYGGAAGGGKSVAQLMAALQFVDIPGYSAILFRKTYADLSLPGALIDMAKNWLAPFTETGEVKWADKDKRFTFPSGAKLSFGYLETDNDCFRYQGAEFQYIGMDEVTHISPANYRYLFSRLRKPKTLQVPLRFRATANPGGQYGEYYHHRFFIEGEEKGRIFIGAGLDDNPYLDKEEYVKALDELDAVTKEQLLNGNWDVREAGDMFSKQWFIPIDPVDIPSDIKLVRFWDCASSDVKKNKRADTTVGFLLGHKAGVYYICDIKAIQATPAKVEKLMAQTAEEDGRRVAIRMEQEPGSSGDMIIDNLARGIFAGYDFKGVRSTGSKAERARPASAAAERGYVYIKRGLKHTTDFLDQAEVFPKGAHDDYVDAFSGAFNSFKKTIRTGFPTGVGRTGSYWRGVR